MSGPALRCMARRSRAAREPYLYEALGVPDTLDGRFDLIVLHAFLLVHHLRELPEPGPALAQAVFDAMFSDMDMNLREIGVSDLRVGKRVRAMWEAFHGRSNAYAAAIEAADRACPGGGAGTQRLARRGAGWVARGTGQAGTGAGCLARRPAVVRLGNRTRRDSCRR